MLLKKAFLDSFRYTGNITESCEAVGLGSCNTVRNWQEHDEEFLFAYREAESQAVGRLETEARLRAVEGTQKPVYQGGQLVGFVTEKSDTLLIFLLKANKPEKYRERFDVNHGGSVEHINVNAARSVLRVGGDSGR